MQEELKKKKAAEKLKRKNYEIESLKKVRNVGQLFMHLRYDVVVLDW